MTIKIIFFGTIHSPPCIAMRQVIQGGVLPQFKAEVEYIDVDQNPRRARREGIHTVPAIKIFCDNLMASLIVGIKKADYILAILKTLEKNVESFKHG